MPPIVPLSRAHLTGLSILTIKDSNSQALNHAYLWILWTIKHPVTYRPCIHALYSFEEPLVDKIQTVGQKIYGADGVKFSEVANANLKQFSDWGYGKLPVCMAKTQYSLSDNPRLLVISAIALLKSIALSMPPCR